MPELICISFSCVVHAIAALHIKPAALNLLFIILCVLQEHTHISIHTSSHTHAEMSAVFLPEVPSHIKPALIIKGRRVRVDPLSVQLRAGDPLIHSSGFVWAPGLTHLPTPQASARPWSEGQLLFSSNNCS